MGDPPPWVRRFRAPRATLPRWARLRPERCLYASTATGVWQVHAWDRSARRHRLLTRSPVGVPRGILTPSGGHALWFEDTTGDEVGSWWAAPFGGGAARPLLSGPAAGWDSGLALGTRTLVAGLARPDGFTVYRAALGPGAVAEPWLTAAEPLGVEALSPDDQLVCVTHAAPGDSVHPRLRVWRVADGSLVDELWDGPAAALQVLGWAPDAGDHRLCVTEERSGFTRPAVWRPGAGDRQPCALELAGEVQALDWYPDGQSLLLRQVHQGRHRLWRHRLATAATEPLAHPAGTVQEAAVRPDGRVWYRGSSAARPPAVRVIGPDGDEGPLPGFPATTAPAGTPLRSWTFANGVGDRVHALLASPAGAGPHPTVVWVHGGPASAVEDAFEPRLQALVDHGLQVAAVNYRGSTGYGAAWRDRLLGDPGFPEVADVVAAAGALAQEGRADPGRLAVMGASWGGYVTLLAIGRHPDRFQAAVARVPVADYPAAYADESAELQAFDRTLFGGDPQAVPERYAERSPHTYAAKVRTPLLVQAGDHDSRCPLRQILQYVSELQACGAPVRLQRYGAGHSAMVVDQEVRLTEQALRLMAEARGTRAPQPSGPTDSA